MKKMTFSLFSLLCTVLALHNQPLLAIDNPEPNQNKRGPGWPHADDGESHKKVRRENPEDTNAKPIQDQFEMVLDMPLQGQNNNSDAQSTISFSPPDEDGLDNNGREDDDQSHKKLQLENHEDANSYPLQNNLEMVLEMSLHDMINNLQQRMRQQDQQINNLQQLLCQKDQQIIYLQQQLGQQGQPFVFQRPAVNANYPYNGNPYQQTMPVGMPIGGVPFTQHPQHMPFLNMNNNNSNNHWNNNPTFQRNSFFPPLDEDAVDNDGHAEDDSNGAKLNSAVLQLKRCQDFMDKNVWFRLFCKESLGDEYCMDTVDEIGRTYFSLSEDVLSIDLNDSSFTDDNLSRFPKITVGLRLGSIFPITDTLLKSFVNLTSLDLVGNNTITDEGISGLTKLTSLIWYENEFITNAGIMGLTNLIHLNFMWNDEITNEGLSGLTNLTELNYGENETITCEVFTILTKLTGLILNKYDTTTDEELSGLTNLTMLILKRNILITNKGIRGLPKLTKLCMLDNNTITDEGISGLTNLTSLTLFGNDIITDEGIMCLTNLTSLDLPYNNTITDAGIRDLTNLTELDLSNNNTITRAGISGLTKLTKLNK